MSRGYTLVQLLVALVLTSLLLAGFVTVHGRTRQAVSRVESLAEVQDTLVQAMAYMAGDLRQAGFAGIAGAAGDMVGIAGPGDPVVLPVSGDCGRNFSLRLDRPVEAYDGRYPLDCTPHGIAKPGADVLVVRRLASHSSSAETGRLQAGLWLGGGTLFIDEPPTESAEVRDLVTSVYYVSTQRGEGNPVLRRKTLVRGPRIMDEEIAPGIEDLQVQLGLDLDGALLPVSADAYVHPDDPRLLEPGVRVVAVRIWLLSETAAPANTFAPAVAGYSGRDSLPAVPRTSRQLLVQTFALPNGGAYRP